MKKILLILFFVIFINANDFSMKELSDLKKESYFSVAPLNNKIVIFNANTLFLLNPKLDILKKYHFKEIYSKPYLRIIDNKIYLYTKKSLYKFSKELNLISKSKMDKSYINLKKEIYKTIKRLGIDIKEGPGRKGEQLQTLTSFNILKNNYIAVAIYITNMALLNFKPYCRYMIFDNNGKKIITKKYQNYIVIGTIKLPKGYRLFLKDKNRTIFVVDLNRKSNRL